MSKIPQQTTQIYLTPLGNIKCGFNSNSNEIINVDERNYENGSSTIFKSKNYSIEQIFFNIRQPINNGGTIESGFGWIFRIEKLQNSSELIDVYCKLEDYIEIEFDISCGEHLDSIEASNSEWILNIGTEDGEILNSRAQKNDWFPERLQEKVNFSESITQITTNGFTTKIPHLFQDEKLHIHFLVAYKRKMENDFDTWFAVDEFKRNLENWIGIW